MNIVLTGSPLTFGNRRDSKCCCGMMHITAATRLLGGVYIGVSILSFLITVISSNMARPDSIHLLGPVLQCLACGLLHIAVKESRPKCLIFFLIIQVLTVISCLSFIALILAQFVQIEREGPGYYMRFYKTDSRDDIKGTLAAALLTYLGVAIISLWVICIVARCYKYLSERNKHIAEAAASFNVEYGTKKYQSC